MAQTNPRSRLAEIIRVFINYNVVPNFVQQKNPEQVKKAFEELGPTFIKIGQMLSVREDLLSSAFTQTFKTLQDSVPSDTFSTVKKTIETELSLSLSDIFDDFSKSPFASASMGQAHRAKLKNGDAVVVKIQHPNIAEEIRLDLQLFERAIPLIKYIPETSVVDLKGVLQEVKRSLINEMDFLKESQNGEQFYQKNNGWKEIRSPKIYDAFCSKKVIVMEEMSGKNLNHLMNAENKTETFITGIQNKQLKQEVAKLLVENFMKQVFDDGFFHADPHPGNLLFHVLTKEEQTQASRKTETVHEKEFGSFAFRASTSAEDPVAPYTVNYIDFGMMGHLSAGLRQKLTQAVLALYTKDAYRIEKAVLRLCQQEGSFDESRFHQELTSFLEQYYDSPIDEINLQEVFTHVVTICHQNNLQFDRDITLLLKAFGTLEGVIRVLDPEVSLMEVASPFAQHYFLTHLDVEDTLKQSGLDLLEGMKAAPKIPQQLHHLLEMWTSGQGKVNLELKKQDKLLSRIESMINRLVFGMILAALIVGSSLLVQAAPVENAEVVSLLGIFTYAIAAFVIIFLAIDALIQMYKKRKK
ncbi:TPA: AarF/ABC1/UbiB kinase family protein [Enterococcus faecium]|uniref:ABC1 kinase family protein n=1 Tax=Enterococcus faecium TaxID=1352 RepID=UPI000F4ECA89|nr:AarF/UbiB family protein [Enterococcus faecium]EGP4990274.1 AarF/ABC1/UbiB kinase family protein [Enterococcus faecium]EHG8745272.1 AarF/ABC1/UbiB kinase family protein [Enterococcus faecium]EJC3744025.1 AarF/ABC1/UbiB kinase family protein [Enterococcus faecium]EME3438275.1 AarF/ABC1/UbiB kinase family protein [Enterococcus faecium]EME8097758.1 AarF/ABC1/UbiB kinase family protein [Enterococcus faecium]